VRIVAHVDMDACYAAVEAQRNPALRDQPPVVGADPMEGHGRGVVTAASYAARRYGIRSAMPISRAWRLAEAARRRASPGQSSPGTITLGSFDGAIERARRLWAEIVSQEGLTASVGIGPNKLIAKIAADLQKPDGLTIGRPEEVQPLYDPLRIRVIVEAQQHRTATPSPARASPRCHASKYRSRYGRLSTHWRTGTRGRTPSPAEPRSRSCAGRRSSGRSSALARERRQPLERALRAPQAREAMRQDPQVRKSSNSCSTNVGSEAPST
jgi:impB/mucB/samB family